MTFEVCLFLVIVSVVGVFVTLWKGLIANTSLDFLRKSVPGEWGPPGVGKMHPAIQLGCDVCGIWTSSKTCSECVTWGEVQTIRRENFMTLKELLGRPIDGRMVELKRRRVAAGW